MEVRYKIRAPNIELYYEVLRLLQERVPVFVASEKRCMLSTGEIPNAVLDSITEMGATVTRDFQYDSEIGNLFSGKTTGI